jgi:hypothetical protein
MIPIGQILDSQLQELMLCKLFQTDKLMHLREIQEHPYRFSLPVRHLQSRPPNPMVAR